MKKIIFIVVISITILFATSYFVLQSASVQTWITSRIAKSLSEELNCKITVSRVDISFFNKLILSGIEIKDQKKQALLKINELHAGIMYFKTDFSTIRLSSLSIDSLDLNLYRDTLQSNYRFIIDYFKKDSSTTFKLDCSYLIVQHSHLHFLKYNAQKKTFGVNYQDLDFKDINIRINRFNILNDTISINIESLALKEQSGLQIHQLNSFLTLSPQRMLFNDLKLETGESWFEADTLFFDYNSIADLADFEHKVDFRFLLSSSSIALSEIAYFSPVLRGMNDNFELSGILSGEIPSLSGENVIIKHKSNLFIHSDFNIIGLPDVENSFYYADIHALDGIPEKISQIRLPEIAAATYIPNSDLLKNLGMIHYKGNFTGFYNDFVAFGTMVSPLGKIVSDIRLQQQNDSLGFSGKISGIEFDIGKLTGIGKTVGSSNLVLNLEGSNTKQYGFVADLSGLVSSGLINDYPFEKMEIEGRWEQERFNGKINLADPNLDFNFAGIFDFSNEIPFFEFSALVNKARLDKLNIYSADSLPELSMTIKTNFRGSNADNLNGSIFLWDINYKSMSHQVVLDKLLLETSDSGDSSIFSIESNVLDAKLVGKYSFASLINEFSGQLAHTFPEIISVHQEKIKYNSFNYQIDIKESNDLTKVFFPQIQIAKSTKIHGRFDAHNAKLYSAIKSDALLYKGFLINGLELFINGINDTITSVLKSDSVFFPGKQKLVNIELQNIAFRDSVSSTLSFSNQKSPLISGELSTLIHFSPGKDSTLQTNIELYPGSFTINDSIWLVQQSKFLFSKNLVSIDSLNIFRKKQMLNINGSLNRYGKDSIQINVNDFPIANLNTLIQRPDILLEGDCTGNVFVSGTLSKPLFYSELMIDSLFLNHRYLGNSGFFSNWNRQMKRLDIHTFVMRNNINTLNFNGYYTPSTEFLNLNCRFNKFHLANLQPFANGLVSEVRGLVSDSVQLSGPLNQLILNGKLKVQKANALVDYLNTSYQFSDFISFDENKIKFDSILVFDVNGNEAICSGSVGHNYFSDFALDISLEAKHYYFLNTTPRDNTLYYGQAFASGSVAFNGPLDKILITVNAKTDDNTRIYIPLSDNAEAETNSVVTFIKVQNKDTSNTETIQFNTNASKASEGGVALDMDLELSPEAEVQLIFDSKVGDIMQGHGNGNLKLEYTREGEFNMYGDYTLSSGKYLFTLANFMSKKFSVRDGGTIHWYGDPYDADLNVSGYYRVNSKLADLLQDTTDYYMDRIPIDCQIDIQGSLLKPEYNFSILLPGSAETEQALLDNMPENEINKQFISLLLINNFQPLNGLSLSKSSNTYSGYNLTQSTSEIISNQLSHWVSQISNDFDVGFSYQPGDQVSTQQLELALRTQLFNDRLMVNGNVGMGGEYENTNSILGDMEAELKLNNSGKVRLKAFSKSNTRLDYEKGPYTRGLGVFYREDFDSFEELWRRYISIFMKKENH